MSQEWEDEEEFLESDEGQRWLTEMQRASRNMVSSMQALARASMAVSLSLSDMTFEHQVKPGGVAHKLTGDLLKRAGHGPQAD